MENIINVMWIDDEHDQQKWKSFIKKCNVMHGIKLIPFKTAKAGMEALCSRPDHFDAVILDAKAFDESENEQTSLRGMGKSIKRIDALSQMGRTIPYYIFTGQADLIEDEWFNQLYGDHLYIKGNTSGNNSQKLIEDIKNAVSNSENIAIRGQYADIFSWIPDEIEDELLDILKIIVKGGRTNTDIFNKIRKILDWLMLSLFDYGLLAKSYNGSELNKCSTFLGKKELSEFVPVYIRRSIHSCTEIANEGSHRLTIDDAVKSGKAPYLVYSTMYELLNILSWFHNLPKDEESKDRLYVIVANLVLNEKEK